MDIQDECLGTVWVTNTLGGGVGVDGESYTARYAEPAPIRSMGSHIAVPEPAMYCGEGEPPPAGTGVLHEPNAWSMLPLAGTGTSYETTADLSADNCEPLSVFLSAVALDEETVHLTREITGGCVGDPALTCQVEIEFALHEACELPCRFVDDREEQCPAENFGDEVQLFSSRCEC